MFKELCKTNAFDTPDSSLVRGKELVIVYKNFEHFCESKEHKNSGKLFL